MKALLWLLGTVLSLRLSPNSPYLQPEPRNIRELTGLLPPTHPISDSNVIAGFRGYSGLLPVKQDGSALFYWLVERIGGDISTDQTPLILWLQGGPGCSSLIGNLYEFGPFEIGWDQIPQPRKDSWAYDYHLLFIDSPFGAGFSYTPTSDYVRNEEDMAFYLYTALVGLCEMHPIWFQNHDFYLFGESYAGKFIPNIAKTIIDKSQNSTKCHIRLQGIGLGNAWVDPIVQSISMSNYSHAAGLISVHERVNIVEIERRTEEAYTNERYREANRLSIDALLYITEKAGGINPYNVREYGNYYLDDMAIWLNDASTKEALHVPRHMGYIQCSEEAYVALEEDQMQPATALLSSLIEGSRLKVLIYTGQDDLICNTLGTMRYLEELGYKMTGAQEWRVDGEVAGHVRRRGTLMQAVVKGAGHMVPRDQLRRSRSLLRQFLLA